MLEILGQVPPRHPVEELEERLEGPHHEREDGDADDLRSLGGEADPVEDRAAACPG